MLKLEFTTKFKKDFKRVKKQGKDLAKLKVVLDLLCKQDKLPANLRDHSLEGNYKGHRELHVEPDWLLIYRVNDDALVLTAVRTGSHSDLLDV
ncbi:MAG: type II toxin-antitoxin system YafQ family toxin [Eggerthellaceae bacterium]|nr:type II toxin-antitoxin system YafQ family toxin [Eggerthellaceae bacterium]